MRKRIWELDALRGICVVGMVLVHIVYDLVYLFRLVTLPNDAPFQLVAQWGGISFVLICGICASFSSHCCRRGLLVFGCGMLCTAVTAAMYFMKFADSSFIIFFGVLHCLGICMLLWPLVKKLPGFWLATLGLLLAAVGLYWRFNVRVQTPWLFPLGLMSPHFASADYYPLLPNFGYFLVGAALGKLLYPTRTTLFPRVNAQNPLLRFLCLCGRHSLPIYLLHQPLAAGLVGLVALILKG